MKKDISLIDHISEILEPMHGVTFTENADNAIDILKNNYKFGEIKKDKLYFFDKVDSMQKLDKKTLSNQDEILRIATKAYWKVSGK